MRRYVTILLLFLAGYSWGQKVAKPKPFAETITAAELKEKLTIVAGDEMMGRETATDGQKKAAAFIENKFRSLGLQPGNNGSYQMKYPVYRDSLVDAAVVVNGKSFKLSEDFAINTGNAYSATLMAGKVVFVGYGISDSTRDDYKGANTLGKVVLILQGTPPQGNQGGRNRFNPFAMYEAAMKNGAAAILVVQTGFPRRTASSLGNMYLSGYKRSNYPNIFYISEDIARTIMGADYAPAVQAMKNGDPEAKTYETELKLMINKETQQLESSNVIAYLEGTDLKDEYVFLTAHYDHLGTRTGQNGETVIYNGADDDGSGTVTILELAEAFAKSKAEGKGPRRSIVFMAVSGEEKGLWGSAWYGDHPTFPLDKTTVDLNIDMIGRIDPKRTYGDSTNYVYVVGDDKLSSDLRPISESMNKKYTRLELDYKYNDPNDRERIYYRSDHYNFARKGVPIIFYFNGTHADYHRPSDTVEKIDFKQMEKRAKLVFYTAWEMANRNDMLKRDIPLDMPSRR